MDVLILAAGLGSRVSKYTHDSIPKYLINIDNHTGLYYLINYWNKYANNIYLVINSNYNIITKFYISNIFDEDISKKINIINYDTNDGTAYTLNHILNNDLKNKSIKNLLITWCDLFPTKNIDFVNMTNETNIYVMTHGNKCRYGLNEENQIIAKENSDGDVIGIFYFHNYKQFVLGDYCLNKDIVDYIGNIGNIVNFGLSDILDYGDEDKLLNIVKDRYADTTKFNCRYFNEITMVSEDKILKKSVNDKGREIMVGEKRWYNYMSKYELSIIPKIFNTYDKAILMEYKRDHICLYKFFSEYDMPDYPVIKNTVLKNVIERISKIHNLEKVSQTKVQFLKNLKTEIFDKVYDRKKKIDDFLNYFGDIKMVNGVMISSFDEVIDKCKNIITQYYVALDTYDYSIILGDCNFSNILINSADLSDIVFIDPRGYFGDSFIYGPVDYDYAKLLYAITGYDNFNANYFNIKSFDKTEMSLNFEINPFFYDKAVLKKYFNKVHYAYVVIIWLSLAEYNKNNIWKCLASYYHGLYLGTLL